MERDLAKSTSISWRVWIGYFIAFVAAVCCLPGFAVHTACGVEANGSVFRAGAATIDVTPSKLPIAVNGNMTVQMAEQVTSPVKARAIVVAQGNEQIALVVVDSCMLPRVLLDDTKQLAQMRTGIAADHIMIAATHTHTAPAAMSCLGTDADPDYQAFLRLKIVDAIAAAQAGLQPASIGWAAVDASPYMAVRRWIRRSDRMVEDPFGNRTVQANMHAAANLDDVTGESGPEDPALSVIAIQTDDGEPLALLANLSMHYFSGPKPISADYFGLYCARLQSRWQQASHADAEPVVLMSHGCSGDIWRRDYTGATPARFQTIAMETYADELVELTLAAIQGVTPQRPNSIAMAEQRVPLKYRVPDVQRLAWAQPIVAALGGELPKTQTEIYAREALLLHEMQATEVVVQAIRLGEIAIVTTPTETYALTGLKLKLHSPNAQTMVLDLANGGDGYIPPPEQHVLGGYNTWPARSAGLEVMAEPKIVQTALTLLEAVCGSPRRNYRQTDGPGVAKLMKQEPLAYWRMDELQGTLARCLVGNGPDAAYEDRISFFLAGPESNYFNGADEINRAVHFAGGRMRVPANRLPANYRVQMWIWNGMPNDGRDIAGWFYSRGIDASATARSEQVGVGGAAAHPGKLIAQANDGTIHAGRTELDRWKWCRVTIERTDNQLAVYLGDELEPEIRIAVRPVTLPDDAEVFFGGSTDNRFNWEGRLDEIAIFGLTPSQ